MHNTSLKIEKVFQNIFTVSVLLLLRIHVQMQNFVETELDDKNEKLNRLSGNKLSLKLRKPFYLTTYFDRDLSYYARNKVFSNET